MSDTKNKFLIRSSGEILGPYSKEELVTLIKKGKVSIFDEVTEPFKIWVFLENHIDFKKAVQSINIQTRLTNFLTQVSIGISLSKSKTKDQTKTADTKSFTQDQKDLPQEVSFNLISKSDQKHRKSEKKISVQRVDNPLFQQNKTIQQQEEKLEKKIGFLVRFTWRFIILTSFLVFAFLFYKISYIPIKEKKEIIKKLNLKGKSYYKAGDFKRAFPFFEKAQSYLTKEEKFYFAILLLHNNQLEKANLIKEEITDPALLQKEAWTLFEGLSYFYSRRYSEAERSFQNVILKNNKETINQALLNLALLKLETRQYNEFISETKQLLKRSFQRGVMWYLEALSFLKEGNLTKLEYYLLNRFDLEGEFSNLRDKSFIIEYKQELLFLLAYTYMKKEKPNEKNTIIKRLLNQDPYFIEEYAYSPFIAKNKLNWTLLYPYCNEMFNVDPEESLTQALYSLCLIKTNQRQKARIYIERAKSQEPENSLFIALYAYLLMVEKEKTQKIEQVFSLINYESKSTRENNLPFIIRARFFEQAEYWESALLVWKDLIGRDLNHISALTGISFNSYQIGDNSTSRLYRKKVLGYYPYHLKLLPLE